jgi:hypothetical protein
MACHPEGTGSGGRVAQVAHGCCSVYIWRSIQHPDGWPAGSHHWVVGSWRTDDRFALPTGGHGCAYRQCHNRGDRRCRRWAELAPAASEGSPCYRPNRDPRRRLKFVTGRMNWRAYPADMIACQRSRCVGTVMIITRFSAWHHRFARLIVTLSESTQTLLRRSGSCGGFVRPSAISDKNGTNVRSAFSGLSIREQ